MSPTSYADEIEYPAEGTFDTTKSLDLFVNNQLYLPSSGYGTVSDSSDLYSLDLDVYSVPFNYYQENSFSTSSNIGFSKLFTITQLQNYLTTKTVTSSADLDNIFQSLYGYKLILKYEDENGNSNPLSKGSKLDLDLFLNDYFIAGREYFPVSYFDENGDFENIQLPSDASPAENTPILELSSNIQPNPNRGLVMFDNLVSVYGTSSEGQYVSIGEFTNITNLLVNLEVPEELTDITIDVSYNAHDSYFYYNSVMGHGFFTTPIFFVVDVSGTISLDDSGIVSGLIEGIIEWLKSILNAILELPQNIANKVKDVIVSLFVPTPEGISAQFDVLKSTAEDKLGFVYTVFNMVYDLFSSLVSGVITPTDTITLPRFSFPFQYVDGGEIVLWEEMTFDIMPDGLSDFQDLIKLVTSIMLITATMSHCVEYFRGFFRKE